MHKLEAGVGVGYCGDELVWIVVMAVGVVGNVERVAAAAGVVKCVETLCRWGASDILSVVHIEGVR